MKVLAFTSLFPCQERPAHGIFLRHRLRHMASLKGVRLRVLAPVPWFPFKSRLFGEYGILARVPQHDVSSGMLVRFTRYFMIPKLGVWLAPLTIAYSAARKIRDMQRSGFDPDVIDAYYLYPEGVAACLVGAWLKKPVMLTALGSDVSQIALQRVPGLMIRWALKQAIATTAVCQALIDAMALRGAETTKLLVVEHGVDTTLFHPPPDRLRSRAELGLKRFTIISVGHLIPRKGHDLAIMALQSLPDVELIIVGQGPEHDRLVALARTADVEGRVRFIGSVDQAQLAKLLGAADLLVSGSEREGIANVLLESLACGTPIAATPVWGSPEVITDEAIGLLFTERSVAGMVAGIDRAMRSSWDREAIRQYGLRYRWERTAEQHLEIMVKAIGQTMPADPCHGSIINTSDSKARTANCGSGSIVQSIEGGGT